MNENIILAAVATLISFTSFHVGKRKSNEYIVDSTRIGISAGVYLLARWLGSSMDTKFFEDKDNLRFREYTNRLQKFALGEVPEGTFEMMFSPEVMKKVKDLEDLSWSVSGSQNKQVTHKALTGRIDECEIMEGAEVPDDLTA